MKRHYVYRITCLKTQDFYIGCRSCEGDPERDIKYLGSGSWCIVLTTPDARYRKTILREFVTREAAEDFEMREIAREADSLKCQNIVYAMWNERRYNQTPEHPIEAISLEKLQGLVESSDCFAKSLSRK